MILCCYAWRRYIAAMVRLLLWGSILMTMPPWTRTYNVLLLIVGLNIAERGSQCAKASFVHCCDGFRFFVSARHDLDGGRHLRRRAARLHRRGATGVLTFDDLLWRSETKRTLYEIPAVGSSHCVRLLLLHLKLISFFALDIGCAVISDDFLWWSEAMCISFKILLT